MASTSVSGGANQTYTWTVSGLGSIFSTANYKRVGISTSQTTSGASSPAGTVISSVAAPAIGTGYEASATVTGATIGTYYVYGFAQVPDGRCYPAGSALVTVTGGGTKYTVEFTWYDNTTGDVIRSGSALYDEGAGIMPWTAVVPSGYSSIDHIYRYKWSSGTYELVPQGTTCWIYEGNSFEIYCVPLVTTYTITLSKGSNVNSVSASAYSVTSGTNVTFTATFPAGYEIYYWYNNDTGHIESLLASFTEPIYADKNLTCYSKIKTCTCSAVVGDTGIDTATTSASSVNYGESCTWTATLKSGYEFDYWYDGSTIISYDRVYTTNVYYDRTLYAYSKRKKVSVLIQYNYKDLSGTTQNVELYNQETAIGSSVSVRVPKPPNTSYSSGGNIYTFSKYTDDRGYNYNPPVDYSVSIQLALTRTFTAVYVLGYLRTYQFYPYTMNGTRLSSVAVDTISVIAPRNTTTTITLPATVDYRTYDGVLYEFAGYYRDNEGNLLESGTHNITMTSGGTINYQKIYKVSGTIVVPSGTIELYNVNGRTRTSIFIKATQTNIESGKWFVEASNNQQFSGETMKSDMFSKSWLNFNYNFNNLTPNTTYYFRLVNTNMYDDVKVSNILYTTNTRYPYFYWTNNDDDNIVSGKSFCITASRWNAMNEIIKHFDSSYTYTPAVQYAAFTHYQYNEFVHSPAGEWGEELEEVEKGDIISATSIAYVRDVLNAYTYYES